MNKLTLGNLSIDEFFAFILDPASPYYGYINRNKIYPLILNLVQPLYVDKNLSTGINPGAMKSYNIPDNNFTEIGWHGHGYIHISADPTALEQNISFEIKSQCGGVQTGNIVQAGTRIRPNGEYDIPFFFEASNIQKIATTLEILIDFESPSSEISVTWFCNDFRVFGIS